MAFDKGCLDGLPVRLPGPWLWFSVAADIVTGAVTLVFAVKEGPYEEDQVLFPALHRFPPWLFVPVPCRGRVVTVHRRRGCSPHGLPV